MPSLRQPGKTIHIHLHIELCPQQTFSDYFVIEYLQAKGMRELLLRKDAGNGYRSGMEN